MAALINASQVTTWLDSYLSLQTKPSNIYNSANPDVELAAQAVKNSIGTTAQSFEKLYNPNLNQEIAAIISVSEQAKSGVIPDSTNSSSYLSGNFLLTHKMNQNQPIQEQQANQDPWNIYIPNESSNGGSQFYSTNGSMTYQSINLSTTPVDFVRDDAKSFEKIRNEYNAGTVSKTYSSSKYMVKGYMDNIPDQQYFIVQHNGYFNSNLAETAEELSVGVQQALELRSEYNIYVKYGDYYNFGGADIMYQKRTVTTIYRLGLDGSGEVKTANLREQKITRNFDASRFNYAQSVDTQQLSTVIAEGYNKITKTVSNDSVLYRGLNLGNNQSEFVSFSSSREADTIIQPNSPSSTTDTSTNHYDSKKVMDLTRNYADTGLYKFNVLNVSFEENSILAATSRTGVLSASDSYVGLHVKNMNNEHNVGPLDIKAASEIRSMTYNPTTEIGSYKIRGGGVFSASSPIQLASSQGTPVTANVTKSFKKADIPNLSSIVNDSRLLGSADSSSISLIANSQNTSFYKKNAERDTSISFDLNNNSSAIETSYSGQKKRNRLKLKANQLNNASAGINQNSSITTANIPNNPFASTPNNSYANNLTYYDAVNTDSGPQYGLLTNNGMGPLHIIGSQIYSYKQNSSDPNKYFRITV